MDQKNRLIIAIAVTLLIVAAMFTSFGRSLFSMRTEHIQLPEPGASSSSQEGGGSSQSAELFQRVEVTPQTVQSVIRTLERSTSYYWELTVETFWTGGSSATSVQTWVDRRLVPYPSGPPLRSDPPRPHQRGHRLLLV